jgi:hypothetical protein
MKRLRENDFDEAALRQGWARRLSGLQRIGPSVRSPAPPRCVREYERFVGILEHQTAAPQQHWSSREVGFAKWLELASWSFCNQCATFEQRTVSEQEIMRGVKDVKLETKCWQCTHGRTKYVAPRTVDFPNAFRNLSTGAGFALAPIVLHQGSPVKHANGYIRKDVLSHFSWKSVRVLDAIRALPTDQAVFARQAFRWLLTNNSKYSEYLKLHEDVLHSGRTRALPPSALLEMYIECAVFPWLYPFAEWCETHLVASPSWEKPFAGGVSRSTNVEHASVKAAFMRKLCSDVPDFAASYPLLQFQFDRYILHLVNLRSVVAAMHR